MESAFKEGEHNRTNKQDHSRWNKPEKTPGDWVTEGSWKGGQCEETSEPDWRTKEDLWRRGPSPLDRLQMVQAGDFELRSWGHGTLGLGVCPKCAKGRAAFLNRRGWDWLLEPLFGFALLGTQSKTLSMLDKPFAAELHFGPAFRF